MGAHGRGLYSTIIKEALPLGLTRPSASLEHSSPERFCQVSFNIRFITLKVWNFGLWLLHLALN